MKRVGKIVCFVICILLLPGCYDQIILEDISLTLMIGLDVDDSNNLVIYQQSPVFYKEAKEKSENASFTVTSLRGSREKFDSVVTGFTTGGKIQTILVGKRLLEQKGWFRLLDLFYRDPKQSSTSRVVIVDGPVKDIFYFQPKDKPRLSLHMKKLIDTANKKNITVETKIQELRRQMKEKGVTSSIPEIKKEGQNIEVTGTGLLNKQGDYSTDLSLPDSTLLLILQNRVNGRELSFTIPDGKPWNEKEGNNRSVTFNANLTKKTVKTVFSKNKFQFDVTMKFAVQLTSSFNEVSDSKESQSQLEHQIAKELQKRFEALIKKCQKNKIDPFGFGLYARAYQYKTWKSVQNNWGKAFAKATVHVTPQVHIDSFGVVE
jgi:Ger(x)C family germination protein